MTEEDGKLKFTEEELNSPELVQALAAMIKKLMEQANGDES